MSSLLGYYDITKYIEMTSRLIYKKKTVSEVLKIRHKTNKNKKKNKKITIQTIL